jgi:hypothetical protein
VLSEPGTGRFEVLFILLSGIWVTLLAVNLGTFSLVEKVVERRKADGGISLLKILK